MAGGEIRFTNIPMLVKQHSRTDHMIISKRDYNVFIEEQKKLGNGMVSKNLKMLYLLSLAEEELFFKNKNMHLNEYTKSN